MNTQQIESELSVERRIKMIIVETLDLEVDPDEIGSDDLLFGGGIGLNSMATIEIIVGIEKAFEIQVPDEDLRVELFDSVQTMADYVRSVISTSTCEASSGT